MHAPFASSIRTIKVLLLLSLSALTAVPSASANIRQGHDSIDLSRTGHAKTTLLRLQEEMTKLEGIHRRIEQLPDLSRRTNDFELFRKHARLVEIQTRQLLSIRRLASSSADTLSGQLTTVDRIAEKSWSNGAPLTATEHDEALIQHYYMAFESLDAGRFRLQDGIVRLRLLAFAADTKVKEVRHIAVSNRQALARDFDSFRIRPGNEVEVKRSKDYDLPATARKASYRTENQRSSTQRTFVRSY